MRRAWFVIMVLLVCLAATNAKAAPDGTWRILHTEWTADDEKGFGDFVRKIAESGNVTPLISVEGNEIFIAH